MWCVCGVSDVDGICGALCVWCVWCVVFGVWSVVLVLYVVWCAYGVCVVCVVCVLFMVCRGCRDTFPRLAVHSVGELGRAGLGATFEGGRVKMDECVQLAKWSSVCSSEFTIRSGIHNKHRMGR